MQPTLGLRVTQHREGWGEDYFQALLLLDYGRGWTEAGSAGRGLWLPEERVYMVRDTEAGERRAREAQGTRPASRRRTGHRVAHGNQSHAQGGARVDSCRLACGSRRQGVPPSGHHQGGRAQRHRLVRTPRRGGLRRADRDPAPVAGGRAARRHHGPPGRRHLRPACPKSGWSALRRWPVWAPKKRTTCASSATRRACWTRCWPRSRKCASTRYSSACANACALSRREDGGAAARASSANCAITSAKAWAGWSFCASSASAAAWRTTWASAKRRRCWPCWKRGAPRATGPRWWWRRNR